MKKHPFEFKKNVGICSKTGIGKCPNRKKNEYWGYNLQQIFEGDVQNPQNGTFTKPCKNCWFSVQPCLSTQPFWERVAEIPLAHVDPYIRYGFISGYVIAIAFGRSIISERGSLNIHFMTNWYPHNIPKLCTSQAWYQYNIHPKQTETTAAYDIMEPPKYGWFGKYMSISCWWLHDLADGK